MLNLTFDRWAWEPRDFDNWLDFEFNIWAIRNSLPLVADKDTARALTAQIEAHGYRHPKEHDYEFVPMSKWEWEKANRLPGY